MLTSIECSKSWQTLQVLRTNEHFVRAAWKYHQVYNSGLGSANLMLKEERDVGPDPYQKNLRKQRFEYLFEETGDRNMLKSQGLELDIIDANPTLRCIIRYQHRIYNKTLSLSNLFQFQIGNEGFAIDTYICNNYDMPLWTLNTHCCPNIDARRQPCEWPADTPYCGISGNNGYEGTWFLDSLTQGAHYITRRDHQPRFQHNCHWMLNCFLITCSSWEDRHVGYWCFPLWSTAMEPGKVTFLESGHYTSCRPHAA